MSDLDALLAIEAAAFAGDRISRRSFRRFLGGDSHASLIVADGDGAILGYALLLFRKGVAHARLYSLAADVRRQVAGTGRQLLAAAEQNARSRGATALRLEVREDNVRAIALYEKSGYRRLRAAPGFYADGATALRYVKPMTDRDDDA